MKSSALMNGREAIPLAECPVGLFISAAGALCVKTEYSDNTGRNDCFIVSSGEFFWGGPPQTIESQRQQMVHPVSDAEVMAFLESHGAAS